MFEIPTRKNPRQWSSAVRRCESLLDSHADGGVSSFVMDQLSWLWQNIIAQRIDWILGLVAAALFGVAQNYWPKVVRPVLYATVGGGVVFVVVWLSFVSDRHLQALDALKNDEPTRSYFTQTQAVIQGVGQSSRALTVSVQNSDIPARDVVSQLLVLEESLDPTIEPLHTKRIQNANDIGPKATLSQHWFVNVQPNARPAFVVFQIRYTDVLRNEKYSQAFFLKFLGSSEAGTYLEQLFNASSSEKTRMEHYMSERGIPSLSGD